MLYIPVCEHRGTDGEAGANASSAAKPALLKSESGKRKAGARAAEPIEQVPSKKHSQPLAAYSSKDSSIL